MHSSQPPASPSLESAPLLKDGPRDKLMARASLAMTALSFCLKDVGDKPRPHRGTITCPECGGVLHYLAKTSKPGTIWGQCSTENCLSWMV